MTDILFYIKIFRKIPFNKISGSEPEFKTEHIYPINYNPVDKKLFEHSKKYSTISDEIFVLKNASVTNSGIVTNGFKMFIPALPHPIFRISFGFRYILKQKIFYSSRRLDDKKKYVLIFDLWSKNNYYHWVIDSLSRLYNIKKKMTDFIVLLPEKSPGFINETLALFDIKNIEYIGEKEFIKVPDLYIQNYTAGSGRQNPLAVNRVREFVLNRVNTGIGKKFIYVSRANQKTRRVNNENEIIAIVKEYGFEIVFFENINFEDQVSLMRNVKCLITSHGANLTNILFMPKGAKVFELIRADKPNFCYWSLASSIGINYYYQLCSICNKDHLIVDTKQFIDNINSLLKG
jgi:hypothetical protein